jgi:hypothetical protein
LADGCPYFGMRRYAGQKSAPLWTVVAYPLYHEHLAAGRMHYLSIGISRGWV